MKVVGNKEPIFALTHLTGCKLDLFSVALEPVDLVCGVRKQMSAVGEIPSVSLKLAQVRAAFAPSLLSLSTAGRFCGGEKDHLKESINISSLHTQVSEGQAKAQFTLWVQLHVNAYLEGHLLKIDSVPVSQQR